MLLWEYEGGHKDDVGIEDDIGKGMEMISYHIIPYLN